MLTARKVIDFIFRTLRIVKSDPDASFELSGLFWYPPSLEKRREHVWDADVRAAFVFLAMGGLLHRQRKG